MVAAMKMAQVLMGGKERHERNSSNTSEGERILNWRNRNGNRTLARSVVGTSQYMAPEVVRGELYDGRCDWWSVAVILYEVSIDAPRKFSQLIPSVVPVWPYAFLS